MTDLQEPNSPDSLQESLQQIVHLLNRQRIEDELLHRQSMKKRDLVESLVHKQHMVELQSRLDRLHSADVAYILEALPIDQRRLVWELVKADRDGDILLEVSDAVRDTLIAQMDSTELRAAVEQLDVDELADLAPDLPQDVVQEVMASLGAEDRAELQSALSYDENQVGGKMDFDMVSVREDVTLEVVLRYLRMLGDLPDHTDKLFVVDREEQLKGVLSLTRLLTHEPETLVEQVMSDDVVVFSPDDEASEAAQAFERYDLISAPVIDQQRRLVGRLTVDAMVDVIREESETEILSKVGLREEEDLFSSVWRSTRNRWPWLAINLVTAFAASRVIGAFESTIAQIVALATLMPIVAGIGGNSGNQVTTLIIRGLALGTITSENLRALVAKELSISLINGIVWGTVMGVFASLLYPTVKFIGLVMGTAMLLQLQVAAIAGMLFPVLMHRFGRDPALGSGILLTATTDSMGFFIFLGLATAFLV